MNISLKNPLAALIVLLTMACSAKFGRAESVLDVGWTPPPGSPANVKSTSTDSASADGFVRIPPPSDADQAAQLVTIKKLFDSQYKDTTPSGLYQLASSLLQEADLVEKNYIGRFVLLTEAKSAAVQRGDLPLFQRAIEGLNKFYEINLTPILTDSLPKFFDKGKDDAAMSLALEVAEWDIERDDYDDSNAIVALITSRESLTKDDVIHVRFKNCVEAPIEYKLAQAALATLRTIPTDPRANLIAGKFFCFRKKNWSVGLPMLAKCADSRLRIPAAADTTAPTDPVARCAVGGKWWDLANDPDFIKFQTLLRWRAGYWYSRSIADLNRLLDLASERQGDFRPREYKFTILATNIWTRTVFVEKGRRLKIQSSGTWSTKGVEHLVPVAQQPPRARINGGPWFVTKAEGTIITADRSGPLEVGLNDGDEDHLEWYFDNVGSATVVVTLYPADEQP